MANYTLVSTVGKSKTYTDQALPAGVDKVEYIVQPKRGDTLGPAANAFVVQFGGGVGFTSFTSEGNGEMKLAA